MNPFRLVGRSNPKENPREAPSNSVSSGRDEFEEPAPLALTPLTGRDTEFSLLNDRWEQAQEGMGQIVLVVGQPGLGKSRLVQTLTNRVQTQADETSSAAAGEAVSNSVNLDSPVIEWRCSQHFQNSELHPVSDYLERFLGVDPSSTARFDRLARHLEDYDLCRPEFVALFAKLLFLPPDERYSPAGLTPSREREETFRALHQWLRAYSEQRSVLFVVEDLHWVDASTLSSWAFRRRRPARPNPDGTHVPPRIQNPMACAGQPNDLGAQSPDAAASGRMEKFEETQVPRCRNRWSHKSTIAPAGCRCWSRSSPGWRVSQRSLDRLARRRRRERERTAPDAAGACPGAARPYVEQPRCCPARCYSGPRV